MFIDFEFLNFKIGKNVGFFKTAIKERNS